MKTIWQGITLSEARREIAEFLCTKAAHNMWAGMSRPDHNEYAVRVQNGEASEVIAEEIEREATDLGYTEFEEY